MNNYQEHLYALIFCGGGGTRLWPFSRNEKPKQFLKIKGKKSLIRESFERVLPIIPLKRIYLITIPEYKDEVVAEIPELPRNQIIVEPARRNTAMAAGLGVTVISKKDKEAIVANIWADHVIEDEDGYRKTLLKAAERASSGESLIATGLNPTSPNTGLGYIEKGEVVAKDGEIKVYELEKFVEKPDLKKAKEMVATNKYLWNVGLFVWRVDTFMKELEKTSPATFERLIKIRKALNLFFFGWKKVVKEYEKAPDESIDVALAEKTKNFLVIEGKFDWLDVGNFAVLWEVNKKDKEGNAFLSENGGDWIGIETKNSMIIAEDNRLIGTYGLEDIIVVATKDTVLVAPKNSSQKVKEIVNKIKEDRKNKFL